MQLRLRFRHEAISTPDDFLCALMAGKRASARLPQTRTTQLPRPSKKPNIPQRKAARAQRQIRGRHSSGRPSEEATRRNQPFSARQLSAPIRRQGISQGRGLAGRSGPPALVRIIISSQLFQRHQDGEKDAHPHTHRSGGYPEDQILRHCLLPARFSGTIAQARGQGCPEADIFIRSPRQ